MKLNNLLDEALKDVATDNKIYHRTNLGALVLILKSKSIKPQHYDVNTANYGNLKKNGANIGEVATARKATFTNIDTGRIDSDTLSGGVGGVEIEIYKDRIKTLRNVKVKPIAETPAALFNYMEAALKTYMSPKISFKEVLKKLLEAQRKKEFDRSTTEEYFNNLMVKEYNINPKEVDWAFTEKRDTIKIMNTKKFMNWFYKYLSAIHYREGEERIVTTNPIPLDAKYLKIKILKNVGADVAMYPNLEELSSLIEKNKELFVVDENYKLLLSALKRKYKN